MSELQFTITNAELQQVIVHKARGLKMNQMADYVEANPDKLQPACDELIKCIIPERANAAGRNATLDQLADAAIRTIVLKVLEKKAGVTVQ